MNAKKTFSQAAAALSSFYRKNEKYFALASAAFYALLSFVVVYGTKHLVYEGFPAVTPYLIIALFFYMVYRRFSRFLALSDLGKKKSGEEKSNSPKKIDDIFADDDENGGYSDNYK